MNSYELVKYLTDNSNPDDEVYLRMEPMQKKIFDGKTVNYFRVEIPDNQHRDMSVPGILISVEKSFNLPYTRKSVPIVQSKSECVA